jgi:hypothetical protein
VLKQQLDIIRCFSYPCENLGGTVLYLPHTSTLLAALMEIVLIDADCIIPAERREQVTTPRQILGPAKIPFTRVMMDPD